MLSWIAGLGLKALAGKMLGNAASGIRGVGRWLTGLNFWQLACIAFALFGAWQTVGRWSQHRHTVKVEGQLSDAVGQLTAARSSLATSKANEATLKAALAKQNSAITAISAKSQAQQAIAAKAEKQATERADDAQATSDRLKRSSRVAPPPAASCGVSPALKEQWQ